MVLSAAYNEKSLQKIKNNFVVKKVKEIIKRYDNNAEIILFGSRARGDWHEESDWDFLVLSDLNENDDAKEKIRINVLHEIELTSFDAVFILFRNRKIWEESYSVTPLYYNIEEEGVVV